MKRELYVMFGNDPKDWCNVNALGPFESEMKAREAIRADIESDLSGDDLGLTLGEDDNYSEKYTILEHVKSFQPSLNTTVKITLKKC